MTRLASILFLFALCGCVTTESGQIAASMFAYSALASQPQSVKTGWITWTPGNVEAQVIIEHSFDLTTWELFAVTNQPPVPIVMDHPREFFRARWIDLAGRDGGWL
jgi:hypothetical protein